MYLRCYTNFWSSFKEESTIKYKERGTELLRSLKCPLSRFFLCRIFYHPKQTGTLKFPPVWDNFQKNIPYRWDLSTYLSRISFKRLSHTGGTFHLDIEWLMELSWWWKYSKHNSASLPKFVLYPLVLPFLTLTSVLHLKDSCQSNKQTNNKNNLYGPK